jgi:hypothetical protein
LSVIRSIMMLLSNNEPLWIRFWENRSDLKQPDI